MMKRLSTDKMAALIKKQRDQMHETTKWSNVCKKCGKIVKDPFDLYCEEVDPTICAQSTKPKARCKEIVKWNAVSTK